MYSFDSRVSFSKVDADSKLTLNSIVDFFQDAAILHSEDIGVGYSYLIPRKLLWVINTWQIDIIRSPEYLERVKITTSPYKFRNFLGYRNFTLESESGEILVKGNSLWSLINFETMKPASVPEELPGKYGFAEPLDMDYCNGKLKLPENMQSLKPILVEKHFLDPNHHVNNGQYINIAMGCLPEDFKVKRLRTEYRKQAFLGDTLYVVYGENETGRWTVSINDEAGKPYAVVEFSDRLY